MRNGRMTERPLGHFREHPWSAIHESGQGRGWEGIHEQAGRLAPQAPRPLAFLGRCCLRRCLGLHVVKTLIYLQGFSPLNPDASCVLERVPGFALFLDLY